MTAKKQELGVRDEVEVTYVNNYFKIEGVSGVIAKINKGHGFPFMVKLMDKDGNPINQGHDDDGGDPGSGNIIYAEAKNLKLVKKYEPKRLTGKVKKSWKVGDKFMPKDDFGMDQDDHDDITGVAPKMVEMKGAEHTVVAIIDKLGPTWLVDRTENYCWLPEWIDAVE